MSEIQSPQNRFSFNHIFLSPDEPRLRAGWRLLFQSITLLLIGGCLGIILVTLLVAIDPTLLTSLAQLKPEHMLIAGISETFAVTLSVFLARRFLDKRSIESLGLKLNIQTLFDILTGIAITLLQMGLIYLFMSWMGWITFEGFAWQFDPISIVLKNTLLFF